MEANPEKRSETTPRRKKLKLLGNLRFVAHERRKGFLFDQLGIRHWLGSGNALHGVLEHLCVFPPIEAIRKLIQIAL